MMGDETQTRDMALRALTKIEEHMSTCDRRYAEGNERMTKMFEYIKVAHEKTGDQIDAATKQIVDMQQVISEAKGASKMAKAMTAAAAAVAGFVGGIGGHLAIK